MSLCFDPRIYPAIFDAHVDSALHHLRKMEERAKRLNQPFNPLDHLLIFLGINQANGAPIFFPPRMLMEHGLLLGHPGSGKTARIAALVAQLIRSRCCTVVLVDLSPRLRFRKRPAARSCSRRWAHSRDSAASSVFSSPGETMLPRLDRRPARKWGLLLCIRGSPMTEPSSDRAQG